MASAACLVRPDPIAWAKNSSSTPVEQFSERAISNWCKKHIASTNETAHLFLQRSLISGSGIAGLENNSLSRLNTGNNFSMEQLIGALKSNCPATIKLTGNAWYLFCLVLA